MSVPEYIRYEDYSDFQQDNPDTPFSGSAFDVEFDRIKVATDGLTFALADVRRDDGKLQNGSVTIDSLSTEVVKLVGQWIPRGIWTTATAYAPGDVVKHDTIFYLCAFAHTSTNFAADDAAGYWMRLDAGEASSVHFDATPEIIEDNVQDAIENVQAQIAAQSPLFDTKQPLDATLTALAGINVAADTLILGIGPDAFDLTAISPFGRDLIDDADAATMRDTLGVSARATPEFSDSALIRSTLPNPNSATLTLYHDIAAPPVDTVAGVIKFASNDIAGNLADYASIDVVVKDNVAASLDGVLRLRPKVAGSAVDAVAVGDGLVVGAPAGGAKGFGTVNATEIYRQGVRIMPLAWAMIDVPVSGIPALTTDGSFNISSIIDNGVGDFTINFVTQPQNANYAVAGIGTCNPNGIIIGMVDGGTKTIAACQIQVRTHGNTLIDADFSVVFYGGQNP